MAPVDSWNELCYLTACHCADMYRACICILICLCVCIFMCVSEGFLLCMSHLANRTSFRACDWSLQAAKQNIFPPKVY